MTVYVRSKQDDEDYDDNNTYIIVTFYSHYNNFINLAWLAVRADHLLTLYPCVDDTFVSKYVTVVLMLIKHGIKEN